MWTYEEDFNNSRDIVRRYLGDIHGQEDPQKQLLSDEAIAMFVAKGGSAEAAAVLGAYALALDYAQLASFQTLELRVENQQRAASWAARAKELKELLFPAGAVVAGAGPVSAGMTTAYQTFAAAHPQLSGPVFWLHMHETPPGHRCPPWLPNASWPYWWEWD